MQAKQALAKRLKELRRRHFGARGKDAFAQRLGIPEEEYARYERGTLPPGNVLVRICEVTGEDLQWLLTGHASRGTVVISGARNRHQHLLTRIAQALEERPRLAAPIEAFVDLLLAEGDTAAERTLPAPTASELIPILNPGELPDSLPEPGPDGDDGGPGGGERGWNLLRAPEGDVTGSASFHLREPGQEEAQREIAVLTLRGPAGSDGRDYVSQSEIARYFPAMFGVRVPDNDMEPMFGPGDILLVSPGVEPTVGNPALCKLYNRPAFCRIWLGSSEDETHVGRMGDRAAETLDRSSLAWALQVLYGLSRAA